jgi:Protein of unknown function (DUF3987)
VRVNNSSTPNCDGLGIAPSLKEGLIVHGEPVKVELPEAPELEAGPFPEDSFPPTLRDYAESLSKTFGVPSPVFLMMMLGTISGAARKGYLLTDGAPSLKNYANIYLLFGLQTGSHKSVVSRIAEPILAKEAEIKRKWNELDLPRIKYELEQKQKALKSAKNSDGREEAVEIARLERSLEFNPSLMVGSATTAALSKKLLLVEKETSFCFSPEAGDVVRVALGLFRTTGMDSDLLLCAYTVERFESDRMGGGNIELPAPCLSLLGMVQPLIMREIFASKEALGRGLTGRFLFLHMNHPLQEDDGTRPDVDEEKERRWRERLGEILNIGLKAETHTVSCSPEAREVFRFAHNDSLRWLNGVHQDMRGFLIRYREHALRVALCLHLASGEHINQLTADTAKKAVALVKWIMAQTLDMLHPIRTEAIQGRLLKMAALVPEEGFITLRKLKPKGFDEAEVKQLCELSNGELIFWKHKPKGGGTESPRVRRKTATLTEED